MIPADTVLAAGIHQDRGPDNIGFKENRRIFNRAVDMRLCGKIYDDIRLLFFKKLINALSVTDIELDKAKIRLVKNRCQGGQVSRVGQLIQADDSVLRVLFHLIENKIASDKSGPAGYDNVHGFLL